MPLKNKILVPLWHYISSLIYTSNKNKNYIKANAPATKIKQQLDRYDRKIHYVQIQDHNNLYRATKTKTNQSKCLRYQNKTAIRDMIGNSSLPNSRP